MAFQSNLFALAMSALLLVACGGSGGGASVEFPGEETAPLNSLTDAELTDICEAYASKAYSIAVQNKGGTCMMGGIMAAMFADMGEGFGGPSGMSSEDLCEMAYGECMASDAGLADSNSDDECETAAANAASCEAPIGEVEACYNDMLSQTQKTFQAFKSLSCSNITSGPPSGTSPISEESPASCQAVQSQCPMVMPH
jgi:hypothetical protein